MDRPAFPIVLPFRDIVDLAKQALANAGEHEVMRRAAQDLAKEGQRGLSRIELACQEQFDQHGRAFIDALGDHPDLSCKIDQINDVLWDFGDYTKPETFDAAKYEELRVLSREVGPRILSLVRTFRVDQYVPALSALRSPPSDRSDSYPNHCTAGSSTSDCSVPCVPNLLHRRQDEVPRRPLPGTHCAADSASSDAGPLSDQSEAGRRSPDLGEEVHRLPPPTDQGAPPPRPPPQGQGTRPPSVAHHEPPRCGTNDTTKLGPRVESTVDPFYTSGHVKFNIDTRHNHLPGATAQALTAPASIPASGADARATPLMGLGFPSHADSPQTPLDIPPDVSSREPWLSVVQSMPQLDVSRLCPDGNPDFPCDLIPVGKDLAAGGCAIGKGSSFHIFKGFCEGAKEIRKGSAGIKKPRGPAFGKSVRCNHCMFRVPFKEYQKDVNKEEEGNLSERNIRYRLRFVQKSHMAVKEPDEERFACIFCIAVGYTVDPSDATIFFDRTSLFRHIARHPRPLPKAKGLAVLEGTSVSESLLNDFDLWLPDAPEPHPLAELAREIRFLPTGVAERRLSRQKRLNDRTPVHDLVQGAKFIGLEWPREYRGEWAYGWHEGVRAMVPTAQIAIDPPPKAAEIRIDSTIRLQVRARWNFEPHERANWLQFQRGEPITKVGWVHEDHWCWTGYDSKDKWGIFPRAFVDEDTLQPMPGQGDESKPPSVLAEPTTVKHFHKLSSLLHPRYGSTQEDNANRRRSEANLPAPRTHVSVDYLQYKNKQFQSRS